MERVVAVLLGLVVGMVDVVGAVIVGREAGAAPAEGAFCG